jgi:hypothetical protein
MQTTKLKTENPVLKRDYEKPVLILLTGANSTEGKSMSPAETSGSGPLGTQGPS